MPPQSQRGRHTSMRSACMLALTLCVSLPIVSAKTIFAGPDALSVAVTEGTVVGSFVKNGTVRQWFGIPYADDTGGSNRFVAPKPRPAYQSFNATSLPPACAQRKDLQYKRFLQTIMRPSDYAESEDCLTANIWAPTGTRATGKAAVMIFVFGGAFNAGWSAGGTTLGDEWVAAQDDVIIVSLNHRLAQYGFPGAPQVRDANNGTVNLGLLDLRAGVDWVYANIAAFGGDPSRIVLFGLSSGGIAVDSFAFAYPKDKTIKGIIAMSGSASAYLSGQYSVPKTKLEDPTSQWNRFANATGCGAVSNSTQLSCMQKIPYSKLGPLVTDYSEDFIPIPDNKTFYVDWQSRLQSGKFLRVPYLASSTSDEGNIYAKTLSGGTFTPSPYYPTNIIAPCQACSNAQAAKGRTLFGVKSWQTRYHGDFPNISPDPGLGAYHTSDLSITFGTYFRITASNRSITPQEVKVSAYQQSLWTAFARDPVNGLTKAGLTPNVNGTKGVFVYELAENNTAKARKYNYWNDAGGCAFLGIPFQ